MSVPRPWAPSPNSLSSAVFNPLNQLRDRHRFGDGQEPHLAAVARDDLPARHLLGRIIAPLGEQVGLKRCQKLRQLVAGEDGDIVHRGQGRQDALAVVLADDRPALPFHLPDRLIRVHRHHQDVPQAAGFFQELDVAAVEQVETAVGEHHRFPPGLELGQQQP